MFIAGFLDELEHTSLEASPADSRAVKRRREHSPAARAVRETLLRPCARSTRRRAAHAGASACDRCFRRSGAFGRASSVYPRTRPARAELREPPSKRVCYETERGGGDRPAVRGDHLPE